MLKDSETPVYCLEYAVFTSKKQLQGPSMLGDPKLKFFRHRISTIALHYRYMFGNWACIRFSKSIFASKCHERLPLPLRILVMSRLTSGT